MFTNGEKIITGLFASGNALRKNSVVNEKLQIASLFSQNYYQPFRPGLDIWAHVTMALNAQR